MARLKNICHILTQLVEDALLIVQSLKMRTLGHQLLHQMGSAFTWYTQLQPGSIHTWDDLQRAFLAQFVSSKKKVSIMDLADIRERANAMKASMTL